MIKLPNRREFVCAASGALAAGGFVPRLFAAEEAAGDKKETGEKQPAGAKPTAKAKEVPRIDTHLHCFAGTADKRFPYHPKGPYQPEVAATPEHLLKCMDGAGVAGAVVVHPEPYGDDHRYLEHCLMVGGKRLKGTLLVFADDPKSLAQLPGLAKRLPVISARIHAYAPERLPPFGKPELKQLWRLAAENGLAIQLHFEPRYAPGFEPLIREFAETTVIIDHLGRPLQGTPEEHAVVVGWSKLKNTIMKISSLPTERTYPHRQLQPVITQLAKAYGPERMIYGGGFSGPETTGESYRAAFEYGRAFLTETFNESEQALVLGGNAQRLFGFEV